MSWLTRFAAVLTAAFAATPLLAALSPESGSFVFQTYTPKIYGANPQNWAMAQDSRGVMYFANTEGVLEFDGVFWRLIRLSNGTVVRALAGDALGRIYVGGQGIFGYLQPDDHGSTRFVPIAVPKADADFLDVWNVVPTSAGVYFATDYKLFFLSNNGQIKVWHATKRFGRIFAADGELFVASTDNRLRRLQGEEFVAGPAGDSLLGSARVAFAMGEHPLLASRQGLFNFSLSEITPFVTAASDYLKQNEVWSIKQLSSGDIAVGTKNGGLVLLNQQGALERVIRKEDGLPSDWVTAIYEDPQHAIWLATDNGLARFVPGLSAFGTQQGIHGSVISELRFAGTLYAGTTSGLFRMHASAGSEPSFEEIKDLHEQVLVLAERAGDLLAGGEHGLYLIANGKAEKVPGADGFIYDIGSSSRDPEIVYTAGKGGVRKWQHVGQTWKSAEPVGVNGQEFRTVVEDTDGTLWSTTSVSIWHIDLAAQPARLKEFSSADGIPAGFKSAYLFRGHVVFATANGLLRLSAKTGRFVADDELGAKYADGGKAVSFVREDAAGNVWITGTGYQDFIENTSAGFRPFFSPLIQTGADELYSIFLDPDQTCWASSQSGALYRMEKLDLKARRSQLPVLLRRVTVVGQKDSLFEGDSALAKPPSLQHRDNDLRFEFAAPYYDAPSALEYQFQLDGDEKKWSNWTTETHKEYTNLFEGAYRFHVRVRDPHGTMGSEVVFPFQIAAPFYRTWWAYLTYVSFFLFAGWLILRWRLDALEEKNRWLEGVVEERTAEVRKERDQNEELLLNILPRPVAAELRSNGNVKPTTFDDTTVCFSDFVGFTLSSEKLPAETLINALNEYFTAFDEIIGRYGLEKLKTIGDAYMFAGGLPNVRPSHAVDAVLAALEMAAAVHRLTRPEQGVNWKIRLGLYSGPVVSGVVGVRKFAFDIWGNTVNFAARMESAGQPGRVNLSETTFQRVEPFIECEPRGAVRIKEGREMEMYFAVGPKFDLLQGPVVDGVPEAFRSAYEKAFGEAPRSFPAASVLDELLQTRLAR
jgi:class 3 adenylate cyclase